MRALFCASPFFLLTIAAIALTSPFWANETSAAPGIPPLLAAPATPAATTTRIAPPAAWISTLDDFAPTPTPDSDITYGFDDLFLDRQINVREQSNYSRTVYRITNADSLQSGARVSWEYDPAYTTLTVHHIRVIRDGVAQDRLNPKSLQTIQQERDYDRHLYDGRLTTFAILEDIRVGDIIDYAATRKGWNPIFDGRLIYNQYIRTNAPIRHSRLRILCPVDRTFSAKIHGATGNDTTATFHTEQRGDDMLHTWEARNQPPVAFEDGAPSWFTQYPWLQISEYPDWASVVQWAEPLYALPAPLPDPIRAKALELTQNATTDSAKAVALLEFVQQEIRYLGMELGTGSSRPNPPADVLSRRFGDCKDKALLYCALMRATGLTAYPALTDTDDTRALDTRLPSPAVFNHAIVLIPKSTDGGDIDRDYFADPTLTNQQGPLKYRGLPDYQRALVIRPGTTRLATIEIPETATSSAHVDETYDSPAFEKPAALAIKIAYAGRSADLIRAYLRQTALDEVAKDYLNHYATNYPGITAAANQPLHWKDTADNNTLTIEAAYNIADFWKQNDAKTSWQCEVYPRRIANYADLPDTTKRTTPLAMGFPFFGEVVSTINLPGKWNIHPAAKTFESPAFIGKTEDKQNGKNQFVTRASWKTTADHVSPDDVPKHIETLKKFRDTLGTTLTHPVETGVTTASFRMNWLLVLVTFVITLACVYIARRMYFLPAIPPPLESTQRPDLVGLGGWLILVAFGVCLTPVTLTVSVGNIFLQYFNLGKWEALTSPASASYQPMWAFTIILEYTSNLLLLIASVFLIALFFKKKRRFAAVFIFISAFNLAFLTLDTFVISSLVKLDSAPAEDLKNTTAVVGAFFRAAIWIPYALVSKRVKYTFTR